MFRKLLRHKQQLHNSECIEILKNEPRGVLSVMGDDGYPYGLPIDHWYCEDNGKLYFHCGKIGHRLNALRRCEKVSFCVYDQGYREEGSWALNVKSVIVFGRMEVVDDMDTIADVTAKLSRKFTDDEVESSVKALEDSFKSVSDSHEALDSWFMSQCVSGDYRYPEEFIEEFKNVTREEIIKAASDVTLDTIFMLEGNVEGGETHE